jgi:DNA-binding NarL/FixJ family response regulator
MEASGTTAWVADDDKFFRIAIRSILFDRLGMGEVIETALLDAPLERMSERSDIAIALFDLTMPGMDSPESPARYETCFPTRESSHLGVNNRAAAAAAGARLLAGGE